MAHRSSFGRPILLKGCLTRRASRAQPGPTRWECTRFIHGADETSGQDNGRGNKGEGFGRVMPLAESGSRDFSTIVE